MAVRIPASATDAAWRSLVISRGDLTALMAPNTALPSSQWNRGSCSRISAKSATGQKSRSRPMRAPCKPSLVSNSPKRAKARRASNTAGRENPVARPATCQPHSARSAALRLLSSHGRMSAVSTQSGWLRTCASPSAARAGAANSSVVTAETGRPASAGISARAEPARLKKEATPGAAPVAQA